MGVPPPVQRQQGAPPAKDGPDVKGPVKQELEQPSAHKDAQDVKDDQGPLLGKRKREDLDSPSLPQNQDDGKK
jgi:hypothetical protein